MADEKGVDAGTERARLLQAVARRDISSAGDVANLALILAGDESRTTTGRSIPVDAGGYTPRGARGGSRRDGGSLKPLPSPLLGVLRLALELQEGNRG
jgi:hypothetical protein